MVPIPTARLALVAAVLSVVLLVSPIGSGVTFLLLNGALLVVALVDWAVGSSPGSIEVDRDLPAVLPLGGHGDVAWNVHNPHRRSVTVALADELAPSLRAGGGRVRVRVPGRAGATARTSINPSRRGLFTPEELAVRVDGPLGLAARQRRRSLPGHLRVYPPFKSRKEAELRIDRSRILVVGLRSAQGRGGGTEFDQLREYNVDDELRRMDWAATARSGKAIVRTYRAERNQTVITMLDNGRVMAGRVDGVPRVEHGTDSVMMLTAVATRLGDRAGLVAFDSRVRAVVPPSHGRDQLGVVTEAMYRLEPELAESDYRGAFTSTLARFRRRALLVVLTELAEQAVNETLLPALPLILRSHLVLIGSVTDPDVAAWAAVSPDNAETAYRKAAAVAALDERHRLATRLRGMGATV